MNENFHSYNSSGTWHILLFEAQGIHEKWYPSSNIRKLSNLENYHINNSRELSNLNRVSITSPWKTEDTYIRNQSSHGSDCFKRKITMKLDRPPDVVISNQNTWFRLFQGPKNHKFGSLTFKHS
jgi:hypothetical protein